MVNPSLKGFTVAVLAGFRKPSSIKGILSGETLTGKDMDVTE